MIIHMYDCNANLFYLACFISYLFSQHLQSDLSKTEKSAQALQAQKTETQEQLINVEEEVRSLDNIQSII